MFENYDKFGEILTIFANDEYKQIFASNLISAIDGLDLTDKETQENFDSFLNDVSTYRIFLDDLYEKYKIYEIMDFAETISLLNKNINILNNTLYTYIMSIITKHSQPNMCFGQLIQMVTKNKSINHNIFISPKIDNVFSSTGSGAYATKFLADKELYSIDDNLFVSTDDIDIPEFVNLKNAIESSYDNKNFILLSGNKASSSYVDLLSFIMNFNTADTETLDKYEFLFNIANTEADTEELNKYKSLFNKFLNNCCVEDIGTLVYKAAEEIYPEFSRQYHVINSYADINIRDIYIANTEEIRSYKDILYAMFKLCVLGIDDINGTKLEEYEYLTQIEKYLTQIKTMQEYIQHIYTVLDDNNYKYTLEA